MYRPIVGCAPGAYLAPMADIHRTDAAPNPEAPATIYRKDYQPPAWAIPDIRLDFDLGIETTRVTNIMQVERQTEGKPLVLAGDTIEAREVLVDGEECEWRIDGPDLVIPLRGEAHEVRIVTEINPASNTQLMGLYASNGMLCTQCEAEGFRRITFHPDRPDVLSRYEVRMEGDKTRFPVLLSNGDCVEKGDLDDGRHYAVWRDPWPKPSYLFALVAGDLVANRDRFQTMSGREVDLAIWVRKGDEDRTHHAMKALKDSMAWDERTYGREYDLDIFNIVAVSDFNMGAMENKSLNIFNTRYILADPETATDMDYDNVEGVVAHEYFHNWSGNRVTCRDWFQLSLKEGFTVLRDQQFSEDMNSAAVKRIEDVKILRAAQFPEDAGPLAHPIRPDSYMEISNFYSATVYNKGAEVIRMMRSIVGPDKFRKGTDLYFDRHDGEAATCDDFVTAIEDGSGVDLSQFRLWYSTPGTPQVTVCIDEDGEDTILTVTQAIAHNGAEPNASEMVIPLKIALLDPQTGAHDGEKTLLLNKAEETFRFPSGGKRPVVSLGRGFSAPIILKSNRSADDYAFLSAHDDDEFARFEAMQQLVTDHLLSAINGDSRAPDRIIEAVRASLSDERLDKALIAEIVRLPTEAYIGQQMDIVDPQAIHDAREALQNAIGTALLDQWRGLVATLSARPLALTGEAKAERRLLGRARVYLAAGDVEEGAKAALKLYQDADNMTNRLAALTALRDGHSDERTQAFEDFHDRFRDDDLVLDKWFTMQALSLREDTLERVVQLRADPDFRLSNPNRVRALYAAFAQNQLRFHDASGAGYRLLADLIIELDGKNPQTAARMVPALGRWRRFDDERAGHMRAELERIKATPNLSRDTSEQAMKSLG